MPHAHQDASGLLPQRQPHVTPTLREIARASGHALSTVSCALRHEPGVARETAERIREVASRLGWRPNPLVSAWLAHIRQSHLPVASLTLAYVISSSEGIRAHLRSPIYKAYFDGAKQRAESLGFHLECFHYENVGASRLSQILINRGIPGLIIAPLETPGKQLHLDWNAFSCATIAYSLKSPCLHRAANHHQHSAALAIENVHGLGYRHIGLLLNADIDARSSHMFSGGFWATASRLRIPVIPPFLFSPGALDAEALNFWLKTHRPEAIVGNRESLLILRRLFASSPPPPVFIDLDLDPSDSPHPGIDQKPHLIGAAAVDLTTSQLFRNERGLPSDPKLILIESRWVPGAPTLPPASPPAHTCLRHAGI